MESLETYVVLGGEPPIVALVVASLKSIGSLVSAITNVTRAESRSLILQIPLAVSTGVRGK